MSDVRRKSDKRPVVCGTDFCAAATEAVDIAAALARRLQTRLTLVHVEQLLAALVPNPVLLEAATLQRRADLNDEAKRLRTLGTNVEEKILSGSAFDQLVRAATKSKARFIVVGAVGHGLGRRLLLGSVAERTAEASPIPTLVVRPGGRLASWIRGRHVLKVLVGYDFSAASDAALRWASQLGEIGKFQITVLYSNWPPDEARRLGYKGPLPWAANPKQIKKNSNAILANGLGNFCPSKK